MTEENEQLTLKEDNEEKKVSYEELVRQVADRIWRQWQQENRLARERGAQPTSSRR